MNTSPTPSTRRLWTFRVVTGLAIALFLLAAPNVLAPWIDVNLQPDVHHPELARWHSAVEGTGDVAGLVLLVLLLRRPAGHPLVVLSFASSALVASALVLPFTGPSLLFALAPVLLVLVTYPHRRLVAGVRRMLRPDPVLAGVAVLAAAALAAPVVTALRHQLAGVGEMAATNQWATYAEHLTTLVLGTLLAAGGLPGWRPFAAVTATAWVYLGAVAVALPEQPDSWGIPGGLAAIAAGAVIALVAARGRRPAARPTASVPV
ncbi:hypothetical protein [Geodermatophilus sp. URMC 64]